ncbi:hypothetical protein SPONN_1453 [uncultured Candidatus Thioglobus sp.]|nr:hypothetical protein SPONN_1453 [uncultured Candidatus Thioglobus sp.]
MRIDLSRLHSKKCAGREMFCCDLRIDLSRLHLVRLDGIG